MTVGEADEPADPASSHAARTRRDRGPAEQGDAQPERTGRGGEPVRKANVEGPSHFEGKTREKCIDPASALDGTEKQTATAAAGCLIAIYPADGRHFGKRHTPRGEPLTLGRGPENAIVLDDDSVSRRHCRVERNGSGWELVDCGSTNGTFANDRRVTNYSLRTGDLVRVGDTVFKFISGSDVEAQYHDTVYRMSILDGLTQTHNKRHMLESLGEEVGRARQLGCQLSVIVIELDNFVAINDAAGSHSGDRILRETASLLHGLLAPDQLLARFGGKEFAVILPGTGARAAAVLSEVIRDRVAQNEFVLKERTVRMTVSIGCVELEDGMSSTELLDVLGDRLYEAKRGGQGRVVAIPRAAPVRRWLAESTILHRVLGGDVNGSVHAFEIAHAGRILESEGVAGLDQRMRELEGVAERSTAPSDLLGKWHGRYLLIARSEESARLDPLPISIRSEWGSMRTAPTSGEIPRELRTAHLTASEVRSYGPRALDRLIARLVAEVPEHSAPSPLFRLPFPLAGPQALANAGTSTFLRAKAMAHAIEVHFRLAVAVGFGVVPARAATSALLAAVGRANRPVTMGTWLELARMFAREVPAGDTHPAADWLRTFAPRQRGRGGGLSATELDHLVETRNAAIGHGAPRTDELYAPAEVEFREALVELTRAASVLTVTSLASVAGVTLVEDEESFAYDLRVHDGPGELFPIRRETFTCRLARDVTYLLTEHHSPLSLAPIVFATPCPQCGRVEVMLAQQIALGPKGVEVPGAGVTTDHRAKLKVPWVGAPREYFEELALRAK